RKKVVVRLIESLFNKPKIIGSRIENTIELSDKFIRMNKESIDFIKLFISPWIETGFSTFRKFGSVNMQVTYSYAMHWYPRKGFCCLGMNVSFAFCARLWLEGLCMPFVFGRMDSGSIAGNTIELNGFRKPQSVKGAQPRKADECLPG